MKLPYRRHFPGQILVLATISMVMLLSASPRWRRIWGYLYSTRRRMQTAADAAAVAGATALRDGGGATADDVASFNGFTNSQNNVTVTVSEPTLPSPYPNDHDLRRGRHLANQSPLLSCASWVTNP